MNRAIPSLLGLLAPIALCAALVVTAAPGTLAPDAHWSAFTDLARPRAFAMAVALPSGEILVVGGLDRADPQITNARSEIVDPLSSKVKLLEQPLLGRLHQSVNLTGNETVIMAGGVQWMGDHWEPVDNVEIYHPVTREWSAGASLLDPRSDHAAVTLKDGRVMVIGGNFGTKLVRSVEIYDPAADAWTLAAGLPRARTQFSAVTLPDGKVLVLGGIDTDGGSTDTTFMYDPAKDAWSDGPRMTMPRLQQAMVVLPNGDILLAGGGGVAAGTSEVYRAREQRFVPSGPLLEPRLVAQIAALPDGRVVVSGGLPPTMTAYRPMSSSEIWDPTTGRWTGLGPMSEGRAWGTLIRVGSALYLVSGNGSDEAAFRSVERLPID